MRFRRRPDAPSEPEPDDRAWARPAGDEEVEPPDPPPPEWEGPPEAGEEDFAPEAATVGEAGIGEDDAGAELPAEPSYEPEEPSYPQEEPAYEPVEEPGSVVVEEPAYEPVDVLPEVPPPAEAEPKVRRWSGDRDKVVPAAEGTVRAAGGVVWSRWQGGLRVVVVHRPRYDDWSLPKGKAGPGESDAECALREVREETGLACSLGDELGTATYHDRHGRLKTVRYYAMEPLGGGEGPQNEVDEVRWLGLDEAKRLLSYDRDVQMLDALMAMAARRAEPEEPPAG
ncbi:MAG: NUDIX hydrolase [Acidimicrobiia bacterium]